MIRTSLKFVSKSPIVNKSALVQVMAWCRTGDKTLPQPMLTQFTRYASIRNSVLTRSSGFAFIHRKTTFSSLHRKWSFNGNNIKTTFLSLMSSCWWNFRHWWYRIYVCWQFLGMKLSSKKGDIFLSSFFSFMFYRCLQEIEVKETPRSGACCRDKNSLVKVAT